MKILVLGAGLQGAACAFDLLERTCSTVTMADLASAELPPFLAAYDRSGRLNRVSLDARDEAAVSAVMEGHDGVLSALPYYFNYPMARLAVGGGLHFADLGGNTEIVRQQETLDGQAREKGVTVLPDCGLAPGMVNILAVHGMGRLDEVDSVKLYVGGLPQHPEPPLNYQIVYSLEGALDYYTTLSWVLREGAPIEVEALTELEDLAVAEPVGPLEAFHTAGGLSTMPWEYAGRVATMEYKTLRYPGHAHVMRAIRDLGLLGVEALNVKGVTVCPRDVFIAAVDPKLRKPDGHDVVVLMVIVCGRKDGVARTVTYRLLDAYDQVHGISAMMRATAFSLSITGQMQVDGRIGPAGVRPAYAATPGGAYIDELRGRGLAIEIQET